MYLYDVNRGRYEDRESFVHSLDPRAKLYTVLLFALICILSKKYIMLLIPAALLIASIALSGVSIFRYIRSMRVAVMLLVAGFLINLIFMSFTGALFIFLKFLMTAFMCVIMIKTTTARELLKGIRKGFHVKEDTAMTMTVAMMFLPILGNDMNEIRVAQASRGADITMGNIFKRLKNSISIMIPLFRKTLDKAEKLANAMDIRCYDSTEPRTEVDPLRYDGNDALYLFCVIAALILTIVLNILL